MTFRTRDMSAPTALLCTGSIGYFRHILTLLPVRPWLLIARWHDLGASLGKSITSPQNNWDFTGIFIQIWQYKIACNHLTPPSGNVAAGWGWLKGLSSMSTTVMQLCVGLNKHCLVLGCDVLLEAASTVILPCKAKIQYLLPLQVSRYCLLAFQSSTVRRWIPHTKFDASRFLLAKFQLLLHYCTHHFII